jgi:hypothetical protein
MTTPEYILEFMRDQDMRYFIVCNGWDREVVKIFSPGDLEDHIAKLKSFFNNTTGQYNIKLYKSNELNGRQLPKVEPMMFEVILDGKRKVGDPELVMPSSMTGIGSLGMVNPMTMPLNREDLLREISALEKQVERLTVEHHHMKENQLREMELLRKEHETKLKDAKDHNQMFQQGLGMLMEKMGG